MITKYQRHTFAFIRKYLSTVVSLGVLVSLFVVMVCSLNFNSEGASVDQPPATTLGVVDTFEHNDQSTDRIFSLVSDVNEKSDNTEVSEEPKIEENTYYIELTEDEIYQLATLIYLEGNVESVECQKAICSVVINRMTMWDMTLEEVIYQKLNGSPQFSPAHLIPYYHPSDIQIGIVHEIMISGPTIPEYVCYFRANRYHSWNGMNDFTNIDDTYFSFSDVDYEQYIKECNDEI